MIVFKEVDSIKKYLTAQKESNQTIGFIPTMGALHQGHLSLVKASKQQADKTVISIFVNPTQFNDASDFEKYPSTIDNDLVLLERAGCDVVFLPSVKEMYPAGTAQTEQYDLGNIEEILEGEFRPGHFQGVAQVVHRLLNIIDPDFIFIGQKDYQQCMVIKRLAEIIHSPVKVVTGNTFREDTGVAMSSRNLRLSENEFENAAAIYKMLEYLKENYSPATIPQLETYASNYLLEHGFKKVDYIKLVDGDTLQPVTNNQQSNVVALVAAFIGEVRLIDNMIIR